MAETHTREDAEKREENESNSHVRKKMKGLNRGAWTSEEDMKLAQVIEINGPKRWKFVASKAGLNRCGKSCRLRWMNYLRPNIKRGNISDQEEDLILRLHKLLGNRWSLIAGRIPGRTDNEIKNYWNSYLSKKIKQGELEEKPKRRNLSGKPNPRVQRRGSEFNKDVIKCNEKESSLRVMEVKSKSKNQEEDSKGSFCEDSTKDIEFNVDDFFDFSNENPSNLEWLSRFLQLDGKISCQFY